MKEYLSVKEFSKLSGIETSTLRYWDDIGLFSPAVRDPSNNYRYYTADQIIAINFITVLSSLNIPLKTISETEGIRNPELIIEMIEQEEKRVDMEMRRLRECYSVMHARRDLIKRGLKADISKISIEKRPEMVVILGKENEYVGNAEFYGPFAEFCNLSEEMRVNLNFPIGGYHESLDRFMAEPGRPDRFFSLDPTGNVKVPAGKYLVAYSKGYFGEFGDTPQRIAEYIEKKSLRTTGPVYVTYLHDEICMHNPDDYISEVIIAVQ